MNGKVDFLILGAMRCGTSTLHHLLSQHPDIAMPKRKEAHYFDFHYGRPYNTLLPRTDRNSILVGEATPEYMYLPYCASRIHSHNPAVKLIVILRNPSVRAYSHWALNVRKELENRSFPDAVISDMKSESGLEIYDGNDGDELWKTRMRNVTDPTLRRHYYLEIGYYDVQINRYLTYFPPESIRIVFFEDLVENPGLMAKNLFSFLGVDPDIGIDDLSTKNTEHRNSRLVNKIKRLIGGVRFYDWAARTPEFLKKPFKQILLTNKVPEPPAPDVETMTRLADHYRPTVERVSQMTGRDLSGWLEISAVRV